MSKWIGTLAALGAIIVAVAGTAPALADDDDKGLDVDYVKGKGVTFKSKDFSLTINNRVQVRFTHTNPEDGESRGSFRLRRYKFKLSGSVYEHWKYKLQVNFAGQGDRTFDIAGDEVIVEQADPLEDAYFQYTKKGWLQPWLGQGKAFFSRERLTSSGKLQFVDRALFAREAEVQRDIGVGLVGHDGARRFEYNVGIYNGNGLNQKANDNNDYAYAARFVFTPFGEYKLAEGALDRPEKLKMAIGVDGYQNTVTINDMDSTFDIYGPEIALKIGGLSAVAEYYRLDEERSAGGSFKLDTGYLQVGYLIPDTKFEVAGRYAFINPQAEIEQERNKEREYGVAFSYYLDGHDYKVQADYRRIENRTIADADEDEFRVQMQFAF